MHEINHQDQVKLARLTGWALIATIIVGIITTVFVASGIDINLSADVAATAQNMLDAELRLRAKAYIALFAFCLEVFIVVGWFFILKEHGSILAAWSTLTGVAASSVVFLGAVFAMNAAELASHADYSTMTNDTQRLMLTGLQATSDYTSFHLGLVMGSLAKAGFFFLFMTSCLLPKPIAAWGLFASLLVVFMIVARDFIPALGHNTLTMIFILANLIAMVSTGLYMGIKGIRIHQSSP